MFFVRIPSFWIPQSPPTSHPASLQTAQPTSLTSPHAEILPGAAPDEAAVLEHGGSHHRSNTHQQRGPMRPDEVPSLLTRFSGCAWSWPTAVVVGLVEFLSPVVADDSTSRSDKGNSDSKKKLNCNWDPPTSLSRHEFFSPKGSERTLIARVLTLTTGDLDLQHAV